MNTVIEKNGNDTTAFGGFSNPPLQVRYSSRNEVEHNQVSVTVTAAQHAGTTSVLLAAALPPPVQLAVAWPVGVPAVCTVKVRTIG
jgi:hypothetical protein